LLVFFFKKIQREGRSSAHFVACLKKLIKNVFVEGLQSRFIRATFVNSDLVWSSIFFESFSKESLGGVCVLFGSQKKINRITFFINSSIKISLLNFLNGAVAKILNN